MKKDKFTVDIKSSTTEKGIEALATFANKLIWQAIKDFYIILSIIKISMLYQSLLIRPKIIQ